jgi:hypothetical protein
MKRIVKTLGAIVLASTAAVASAASGGLRWEAPATNGFPSGDNPWPSSAPDGYFQTRIFPNLETYQDGHRNSIATQASVPGPTSAPEEYSMTSEFPNVVTYKREHRDTVATQAEVSDPTSVPEEYSLDSEFPNILTYQDGHGGHAIGATR